MRKALQPIDATNGRFGSIGMHPQMGTINFAHITLADLSRYFPEHYGKVAKYHSVAIVRDPVDRFFSAMFQRLREFGGYQQSEITGKVLERESNLVIAGLTAAGSRLPLEYVHFNRQTDYIFHGGQRIVAETFALDRLPEAATCIETWTGVRLDASSPENRTVALRAGPMAPIVQSLRRPYAALVPQATRDAVRTRLTKLGVYGEVEKRQFLVQGGQIDRFIRDYYADDFDLHAAASAR